MGNIGNIDLNNVTVQGSVQGNIGSVTLVNKTQVMGSVKNGNGKIELQQATVVGGAETTSGKISITRSVLDGHVKSNDAIAVETSTVQSVEGGYGDITLGPKSQIKGNVSSTFGKIVIQNDSKVQGSVTSISGKIEGNDSTLTGSIETIKSEIKLTNVTAQESIKSNSGNIVLDKTTVEKDVSSKSGVISLFNEGHVKGSLSSTNGDIILGKGFVDGNVSTVHGKVILISAIIKGSLTLASKHFKVNNSTINGITLKVPAEQKNNVTLSCGGNVTISYGNSIVVGPNAVIGGQNMGNVIKLLPGARIWENGFNVSATQTETSLITPDGTIYVNGDKVNGPGANTYAEFKKNNPKAPPLQGPGWKDEGVKHPKPDTPPVEVAKAPDQILELESQAIITGDIVFESGNGKLILHPGATFTGKVEGGVIENAAT
ncbi:MAG: hypothetical protein K2X66_14260 [Cyanobacteria bacterium]|nr:hypothetical protein [Cyanobacteriota bacterium]